jgi:hypothetical protein
MLRSVRERAKVSISDSVIVEKTTKLGKDVGSAVANTTGFLAWSFGRLFRPISRRVRRAYDEYKSDLTSKE